MKVKRKVSLIALLSFSMAATASNASDAAMAKLTECMKLKAATPEQHACLSAVQSLRSAPKPAAAMMQAPAPKAMRMAPGAAAAPTAAPAAPKVIPVPADVKAAAAHVGLNGAGNSVSGIGGGITVGDIKGMDLESAMMAVQSKRADLLESQLKGQLDAIGNRNKEIAKLNGLIVTLNGLRPAGTDPKAWGNLGKDKASGKQLYDQLKAAGVTIPDSGEDKVDEAGGAGIYDARRKTFDTWVEQIKGKIDAQNSSQQMDMLRMQSLTNKRNEAFELMTNFIKKMADSRSSVLGNMR